MKKLILFTILCFAVFGCAGHKYKGWEYVRIEKEAPSGNCDYKVQESCRNTIPDCYQWYKKRATQFDANTVVITDMSEESRAVSFGVKFRSDMVSTMMADYYYCSRDE